MMNYVNKMVKATLLPVVVFGFVGCGSGACCESDVNKGKGLTPNGTENKQLIPTPKNKLTPTGTVTPPAPKAPIAPIAVINDHIGVISVSNHCQAIPFTSIGSYDPDGDNTKLHYMWTTLDGKEISQESDFSHKFPENGIYETTLTVTDEQNLTGTDKVCILVGIDESHIPLVADAGKDIEVSQNESVTLSGRAVCRDDVASYIWQEEGTTLSEKPTFTTSKLPVGEHTLKLIIEDFAGNKTCDKVKVTVK
jgi:PKD repeat protein